VSKTPLAPDGSKAIAISSDTATLINSGNKGVNLENEYVDDPIIGQGFIENLDEFEKIASEGRVHVFKLALS